MKKYVLKFGSLFILAWLVSYSAWAQFDDIYFDPDADEYYVDSYTTGKEGDTYVTENYYYDDDDYDYYDREEDFYYSSRIRRFSRPFYYSAGFYDPFFYDPFYYGSGLSISFGNFNRWNRWNRWNRFNNYWYGYGNYYDPFFYGGRGYSVFDSYFGYCPPSFFGRSYGYGGYGYGNSFYNVNNYYGAGYDYYQPTFSSNRGTYYGTRRNGSVTASPSTPVKSPRSSGTLVTSPGNQTNTSAVRSGGTEYSPAIGRTSVRNDRITKTYTPSTTDRTATRETYRAVPNNNSSTRSLSPSRTETETKRTYSPSPSNSNTRSYTPSRSATPSRSYTPSRSTSPTRSYTPSRSSTPSRSISPSDSGSSSPRSFSPSSGSSTRSSSPASSSSSRSSSPRRN
jgi:hypothetical protein